MEQDPWIAPYSIKIMNNFLDGKYYAFLNNIIQNRDFYIKQCKESVIHSKQMNVIK